MTAACRAIRWLRSLLEPRTHPDWAAPDPFQPGTTEPDGQ